MIAKLIARGDSREEALDELWTWSPASRSAGADQCRVPAGMS